MILAKCLLYSTDFSIWPLKSHQIKWTQCTYILHTFIIIYDSIYRMRFTQCDFWAATITLKVFPAEFCSSGGSVATEGIYFLYRGNLYTLCAWITLIDRKMALTIMNLMLVFLRLTWCKCEQFEENVQQLQHTISKSKTSPNSPRSPPVRPFLWHLTFQNR